MYHAQNLEDFTQGLREIFTKESYEVFKHELLAMAENKTVYEGEGVSRTLNGDMIYFDLRWIVVPGYEQTLSKVLVSIVDLTARKQAEAQVTQIMHELERSNAELGQFAYIASHDLQQPLNIVALYLQILARRYRETLGVEAEKFLDGSLEVVTRMQDLIQDLLAYSHLNKSGIEMQLTDCNVVFADALANLQILIDEQQVTITYDVLPSVMANDFHLLQLFQNLLNNGIKFRSKKPPRIHVTVKQQGSEWLFAFQDNGIGIAPDHLERIFMVFERIHSRDKYPGSGIGLATCKRIIEIYGGRIWVESEPGK